jgi:hypothetical protein
MGRIEHQPPPYLVGPTGFFNLAVSKHAPVLDTGLATLHPVSPQRYWQLIEPWFEKNFKRRYFSLRFAPSSISHRIHKPRHNFEQKRVAGEFFDV